MPAGEFGAYLRRRRAERELGLRELARRVDLEPGQLSRIERGERPPPGLDKLAQLASILECDLGDLLEQAGASSAFWASLIRSSKLYSYLALAYGRPFSVDVPVDNILQGDLRQLRSDLSVIRIRGLEIQVTWGEGEGPVTFRVPPEAITLYRSAEGATESSARNRFFGVVRTVRAQNALRWVTIDCDGLILNALITERSCQELGIEPGRRVYGAFKVTAVQGMGAPRS